MAGEKSKTSGEIGEKISTGLLNLIGWTDGLKNTPIKCNTPAHLNEDGNQRQTHGEDGVFLYNSAFHDDRTDIVHVSVKNKIASYPPGEGTLRTQFKSHLKELHETIECARFSPELKQLTDNFSAKKNKQHAGLLIWLQNDENNIEKDIKAKLSSVRVDFGGGTPVYLIDNARAAFILKVLDDVQRRFSSWEFFYPQIGTALNVDQPRTGKKLPLELIASDVIPIFAQKDGKSHIVIYADQKFESSAYKKLIAYGLQFSSGLVATIEIGMPNFNSATDEIAASSARLAFSDRPEIISPFSFNRSILDFVRKVD